MTDTVGSESHRTRRFRRWEHTPSWTTRPNQPAEVDDRAPGATVAGLHRQRSSARRPTGDMLTLTRAARTATPSAPDTDGAPPLTRRPRAAGGRLKSNTQTRRGAPRPLLDLHASDDTLKSNTAGHRTATRPELPRFDVPPPLDSPSGLDAAAEVALPAASPQPTPRGQGGA